jgi:Family of unknown function (DUF5996)
VPAPAGSGALVAGLDLHRHEALAEHGDGRRARIPPAPDRATADIENELLDALRGMGGPFEIDPTPQEVRWTVPLDEDREHATYDAAAVEAFSPRPPGRRSCSPSSARPTAGPRRR